jgi:antitoxin CcdA
LTYAHANAHIYGMSTDMFDRDAPKKATNVSLNVDLLEKAKTLGINVSQACERGLAQEVARLRAKEWAEENREAIHSMNEYVEKNGLPLAKYRQF